MTLNIRIITSVILCMTLMIGTALAQAKLPWRSDSLITLAAEGEEISDVLRTILRSNRMISIFKGAVEGTVNLDEEDVPAQGIFNKLITEFELQYSYDAATRTVTIQPKKVALAAKKVEPSIRDFVVPKYVNFVVVKAVLEKSGLGTDGVVYDSASGTIALFGKSGRLQDIKLLIEQLDKSADETQGNSQVCRNK